jgi:hypothetical protein
MSKERKRNKQIDPDFVICPCCGKQRDIQKQTRLLAIQQAFSDNFYFYGSWAVLDASAGLIQWACNSCLEDGAALEGKLEKQTFLDHRPYLAYIDRDYVCEDCHNPFIFRAREQQYWYEELKFWVQSYPKQCPECRWKRRAKQKVVQDLQNALSHLDPKDPKQLLQIASLYAQAEYGEKAQEYLARARNRARRKGVFEVLQGSIEALQRQIEGLRG